MKCEKMILLVLLSALQLASSQPTACQEDAHCSAGFYCEVEVHYCRECLRCEELMRQPAPHAASCVKSVADCGPCVAGLVEDIRGDVNSPCVSASSAAGSERDSIITPLVAVGLGALFLIAIIGIVIYVLRNTDTFKVLASTRASVQSPPEPPPPYRASPPAAPAAPPSAPDLHSHHEHDEDSSWPFIKRSPPYSTGVGGAGDVGSAAREQAAAQAARAYCTPSYVRPPLIPNGYEIETDHEELDEPFVVHDEDTMESVWTPHQPVRSPDHTNNSAAGIVATPQDSDLAPPAKRQCVPQDTNNNKGAGEGPSPSIEATSSSAPSFIISVVQNIHTVQQRNDVKL